MSTLRTFSENNRNYFEYQARQNFIREQRTIQKELEAALTEKEEALMQRQEALAEVARLKAILEQHDKAR